MPAELDSCVRQVKAKGNVDNAWAVCRSRLGTNSQILARRRKKREEKKSSKRK